MSKESKHIIVKFKWSGGAGLLKFIKENKVENNTEICEDEIESETESISEDEIESDTESKEEEINKRKEKIVCECGVKIVKWSLNRHKKSKIHENLMKLKTSNEANPWNILEPNLTKKHSQFR